MSINRVKGAEGLGEDFAKDLWFPSSWTASRVAFQAFVGACDILGEKNSPLDSRQSKPSLNFTTPDGTRLSVSNSCHWLSVILQTDPASPSFAKPPQSGKCLLSAAFAILQQGIVRRWAGPALTWGVKGACPWVWEDLGAGQGGGRWSCHFLLPFSLWNNDGVLSFFSSYPW